MDARALSWPFEVEVVENLFVPLPDGAILAAKLWRPKDSGPVPAIMEYLPYRRREGTPSRDNRMHSYLAGHGYACLRLDICGTGDSEGLISDECTEAELQDGCDAIAWIAAQGWCCAGAITGSKVERPASWTSRCTGSGCRKACRPKPATSTGSAAGGARGPGARPASGTSDESVSLPGSGCFVFICFEPLVARHRNTIKPVIIADGHPDPTLFTKA